MKSYSWFLIALLASALMLAGCGDDDSGTTDPGDTSTTSSGDTTTTSSGDTNTSSSGDTNTSSSGDTNTSSSGMPDMVDTTIPPDVPDVPDVPMRTVCDDYCETVTANCTGSNEQYADLDACLTSCEGLPEGAMGDMSGIDSVHCRLYHAGAPAMLDPTFHCSHAGLDGGGVCVENQVTGCDRFCANVIEACANEYAVYASAMDCTTECAAFADTGAFGDSTGNTIQCRDRYAQLALAADGDKTLCLLTAPDGGGVCLDATDDKRIDRMGRPAINTALIAATGVDAMDPTDHKDLFNYATPADGSFFEAEMTFFLATIDGAFDNDDTNGAGPALFGSHAALAGALANDVLLYSANEADCAGGYLALETGVAGNCGGRTLEQDVMDLTLQVLVDASGTLVISDSVDADDGTPSAEFPYLDVPGN